ncbi:MULTISPECIES: sigma-54-dependent transcriptional regulator [unclassified Corallococcus]|uniref:sigma-54-dependent transcriptional regulator n=1 Tax=unclassified Corallococcus TaxID=2685029 RepID=UPI001A9044B4|nr:MULTISPECIES: sigma 54-interacting transcriptional regulator [unclassified Corallococcus]MBN9683260.1 sigma-54-dependent Fis family transcriptional regulator [Corallococcus sp. NCSPR001]WAS85217.1 sigma 54-interacting transcriptional regulator [Corallococcus sp. NCRR]
MQDELAQLMAALRDSRDFETAAAATLRRMLAVAEGAVAASRYAGRARVLRGIVHLRPGEAYRRLAALDVGAREVTDAGVGTPFFTSATAWRAVVEHRCAVSIDVNIGTVQPHAPDAPVTGDPGLAGFHSNESKQRFLGRHATHVCVLPLRTPAGMEGMISLEADCLAAMGQEFVWRDAGDLLQLLTDIAAPYLTALPQRPVATPEVDEFLPVVGRSMAELLPILRTFALQDETILVSGATGAGKSRLARWCHERSGRRGKPFETLDLVTVPEDLQMAELFGWKKGAFTGAVRDAPGVVARSDGGTLFIDEIDKLSLKAQAGLLHLLESRSYRPLGEGTGEKLADVRFIIGTNADLHAQVRAGRFREDLYYRVNVLPVRMPPLQDRQDEIPLWARYMVNRRHRERLPEGSARLAPEAEVLLTTSSWPGNLRQLDNIVRRAYSLAMVGQAGNGTVDLVLQEKHVAEALGYEQSPGARPLPEALRAAAQAFVGEARRRGSPLDLDYADGFRGLVLGTAIRQVGRDEAFRLLGRESLVKNRNHHKALKRELEKVDGLYKALGEGGSPFSDLLENEDSD